MEFLLLHREEVLCDHVGEDFIHKRVPGDNVGNDHIAYRQLKVNAEVVWIDIFVEIGEVGLCDCSNFLCFGYQLPLTTRQLHTGPQFHPQALDYHRAFESPILKDALSSGFYDGKRSTHAIGTFRTWRDVRLQSVM